MRLSIRALCCCVAACLGLAATNATADPALRDRLLSASPGLGADVLDLALDARDCAVASGRAPAASRLAVIDYSRPSTEPRLWLLDVDAGRVLAVEHVAHGRGSGENHATRFSNVEGSYQTSLGLYVAGETYHGGNGYSLRLDGLDPGFNDRARERLIVIHGAPLPVHLVYRTAALDAEGRVRLLADPYGRDPVLLAALERAPPR